MSAAEARRDIGLEGPDISWAPPPAVPRDMSALWRSAYWRDRDTESLMALRHEVITQLMGPAPVPASTASAPRSNMGVGTVLLGLAASTVAMAASTRKKARRRRK